MRKKTHEEIQAAKPSMADVREMARSPIFVLLNNVRSLHNVGSIFRTAEGAAVEKIFLCGITGVPPRKEISKTALGAEEIVPYEYFEEAREAIMMLKNMGVQIVVVELAHDSVAYDVAKYDFPVCFVFGHEVEGVDSEIVELADMVIDLPMLGRANSLNVSVCAGIVLYEALKQLKS